MYVNVSAVNNHPWFVGYLPGVLQSTTTPGLWDICQGYCSQQPPLVYGISARGGAVNNHPWFMGYLPGVVQSTTTAGLWDICQG
jgi:hypothetical protein